MAERPSQWGQDTRESILEQLSDGKSLREICSAPGMPSDRLVRKWAALDADFGPQYVRAREAGMDAMADEIIAIADDTAGDIKVTSDGKEVVNQEAINRSRLRVDARKWIMSKIAPKTYGDKLDLNHSGSIGTMDEAAVDARLLELLRQAGGAATSGAKAADHSDDAA
jgi:hypothetical protein